MSSILCPNCKKPIAIEEALRHDMEEKFQKETEQILKEAKEKIVKEAYQKGQKELEILKEEMRLKERKLREAEESEITLRKEKLRLEEEKRSFELEKQRQIDSERQKIREETTKEILDSQKMKELEKDKIIGDLKKSLEEAQRKATQSSQQLQGEVQELDLELTLKSAFPTDLIEPVEKGIRGADLSQTVKTSLGNTCGIILWESKRTSQWSDKWITKLKDDARNAKAHICIIVSCVIPKDINEIGYQDGVWIIGYKFVLPIAELLRSKLVEVAREKFLSQQNKVGKAEDIYNYVNGHEFKQQIEVIIEMYHSMHEQLNKERTAYEKYWKIREIQINKILNTTAGIIGNIEGRTGTLLQIKGLDLPALDEAK